MYPTLKSCNNSPATDDETQTTAATPSTTATPFPPETPSETISSAAISNVDNVKPDTGLCDDPMNPTKFPETVAKKKPTMSMTTAARTAGQIRPEIRMYKMHIARKVRPINPSTVLKLIYRSVRFSLDRSSALCRISDSNLLKPEVRLLRILKRV